MSATRWPPLWQILIATIPHRHEMLCGLLAELDAQMRPGVAVLAFRDNCERTIAAKRQLLLTSATADYVCFCDDDDWIAPGYTGLIRMALQEDPDYVGFRVRWLVDGEDQLMPIFHSLRYQGWWHDQAGIYRDISHLNPLRRRLALLGRYEGADYSEDSRWAAQVRASGQVRTQAWIGESLYWYRWRSADHSGQPRVPLPASQIKPLPAYPWLAWLDPEGREHD